MRELITKATPRFNYTGTGWEGTNYDQNLSTTEICKRIRQGLKIKYPTCKFAVTKEHHSAITISLQQSDFSVFAPVDPEICQRLALRDHWKNEQEIAARWKEEIENGHVSINHYYIADDHRLNEKGREMFTFINKFANTFNFDDSDGMIDYFHTNFYLTLSIGRWNRKYQQITK